uniref:TSA: Wollemia nobilis Ref_Wollemi_Transcript_92_2200 transcribed RNA sequence n=1 Tax=Wollemia nobilis TaxID=56998 RepID=A0A0C9S9K0_9CONI
MGKKGNWFNGLKKAFSSNPKEKTDSKPPKEKRKWGFGKFKHKDPPAITAPPPPPHAKETPSLDKTLAEAEEEQNKHALAVAVATAAAAEAAVAAAQAAAEIVRLTDVSRSRYAGKSKEECAAIKIQTAFRAYLARRALRALKGLVRLQALVRGQTVRRQATNTLRCMQALVRVQSQVRARRLRMAEENRALQRQLMQKHAKELENMRASMEAKEWDDSLQSKEEIEASLQSKQEAAMKRERALAYAFSHQSLKNTARSAAHPMLMEIDPNKPNWGWSWLERWMAARPWEKEAPEGSIKSVDQITGDIGRQGVNTGKGFVNPNVETPNRPRTLQKPSKPAGSHSPFTPTSKSSIAARVKNSSPRSIQTTDDDLRSIGSLRSERPRHCSRYSVAGSSIRDDESLASSPAIPNYMAPTESAKAKARSHSTPKQRPGSSDNNSVASAKKRLSFPLTEGEVAQSKTSRNHALLHTNSTLKGLSVPVKSDRSVNSMKDLSIDSDRPLLNGDSRKPVR